MNNKKQNKLWIVITIVALVQAFIFSVSAETSDGIGATSGTCGTELTWELSTDGTLIISGTGAMSDYTSSIGTPWETRKSSIITVIVNDGATTIGNNAFGGCTNITSVTLPGSIRTIGDSAFLDCSNIGSIILPEGIISIGSDAFGNCDKLTEMVFPDSLESIGKAAFSACDSLNSVTMANGVTWIGEFAFMFCGSLRNVTLSGSLTEIPRYMFEYSGLSEITIPEGITTIGSYAFNYDELLTTLYLPSTIENISSCAFGGCGNLTDIYYPGTQAEAGQIQIGTDNTYLSEATWHFNEITVPDLSELDVLRLPTGLTIIEEGAFEGLACEAVIVPDGCISIESKAFANCRNLVYISLPANTAVAQDAFTGSTKVQVDRRS